MSLLNDALCDLNQRRAAGAPMWELATSSPTKKMPSRFRLIMPLLVVLLIFCAYRIMAIDIRESTAVTISAGSPAASPIPDAIDETDAQLTTIVQPTKIRNSVEKHDTHSPVERRETQTFTLLALAEQALDRDQLTRPEDASALYLVQEALALSPGNQQAIRLNKKIQARYEQLIEQALQQKKLRRAEQLLARHMLVDPAKEQHARYRHRITLLRQSMSPSVVKAEKNTEATISPKNAKDSGEPNPTWVRSSLASRDKRQVEYLRELSSSQAWAELEQSAKKFIADEPRAVQTPLFLLRHYLEQGAMRDAESLLNRLPTDHEAMDLYRAHLAATQGHVAEAITLLEHHPHNGVMGRARQSLLAGLYHKNGEFERSSQLYRRLLQDYPGDPNYLLGLGLSSDALGRKSVSLAVYQEILRRGRVSSAVRSFVRQRVASLDPQSIAGN